jgi:hypothetical protein
MSNETYFNSIVERIRASKSPFGMHFNKVLNIGGGYLLGIRDEGNDNEL